MVEPFTDRQLRVLAALAEKAATVPDTYPMTLRGLQAACNQRTSRDPVTDYDEHTISVTLDELKARGVVRFVHASHGARTTKYRHVLDEQLDLGPGELALLVVLVLRGPQTLNELRTRTERAHAFSGSDEVEQVLEGLAQRQDPLVVHLPRQPGQKETRWMHLLGDQDSRRPVGEVAMDAGSGADPVDVPTVGADRAGLEDRVTELEDRVAALEALLTDPDPSTTTEHPLT